MSGEPRELEHLGCAACGATLSRPESSIAICGRCEAPSLVLVEDHAPRYFHRPYLDAEEAIAAARATLLAAPADRRAIARARFDRPELCFAPFYEVESLHAARVVREGRAGSPDTRILLRETTQTLPAADLPGLGLERVDLKAAERLAPRVPFDRAEIGRLGVALLPDPFSARRFVVETPGDVTKDEVLRRDVRLVYVPIWRIGYRVGVHPYTLAIDGLSGAVLDGRAPEDRRRSRAVVVGALAMVAVALGRFAHGLVTAGPKALLFAHPLLLPVFALFGLVLAFPAAVLWAEARYRGEVAYGGGAPRLVRHATLPETPIERALASLFGRLARVIDEWFDAASRNT